MLKNMKGRKPIRASLFGDRRRFVKVRVHQNDVIGGPEVGDGTETVLDRSSLIEGELELVKTIGELKKEQRRVLAKYHEQIEQLNKANQKLQFELVMGQSLDEIGEESKRNAIKDSSNRRPISSQRQQHKICDEVGARTSSRGRTRTQNTKQQKQTTNDAAAVAMATGCEEVSRPLSKVESLEKHVHEWKIALRDERCRNTEVLKKLGKEGSTTSAEQPQPEEEDVTKPTPKGEEVRFSCPLPFSSTLDPFLVYSDQESEGSRAPTLDECEVIVRALKESAERQENEIYCIRTDLKDVLKSRKLTPESYLLAKFHTRNNDSVVSGGPHTCRKTKTGTTNVISMPRSDLFLPRTKSAVSPKLLQKSPLPLIRRHPCTEVNG